MRGLVLALILFSLNTASAQEKILEEKVEWKSGDYGLGVLRDSTGKQYGLFQVGSDIIRIFYFNPISSLMRTYNIIKHRNEFVRGGFIEQNKIFIFLENYYPHKFHNYELNNEDGSVKDVLIVDKSDLKILDQISTAGHFMYFTADKKASEFTIYN